MGPKKKKTPRSAFSFFLDDYLKAMEKKGRHISYKIAAEECGPLWQDLPMEEKEKYSKLASDYKFIQKQDKTNKFTCTGISFAQLEKEQEDLKKKIQKADKEIKTTLSNLNPESLKTHLFYLIHCNYYCKTDADVYVPGELAIVEFNLKDGVRRTLHFLINPGSIPLGFAFEAKKTIEEIHGLPYPPFNEGESDYFGLLEKILNFLEPGKLPDGSYPPLYTIENNIRASESVLQSLSECTDQHYFRVYLLHKMFFFLKNTCVQYSEEEQKEIAGFPVLSTAEAEISKDVFCYTPGISCPYHTGSDSKYQNCSLSVVQRCAYIICDHCCQYVGVELIPGKHCRQNCDTDRTATCARIEKESKRRRASPSPPPSEAASSYVDDFSVFNWRKDTGGSFLHDEIASKFGSLEISSVGSRSTRRTFPFFRGSFGNVGVRKPEEKEQEEDEKKKEEEEEDYEEEEEEGENDEEEEKKDKKDYKRMFSLGRGLNFR